MNQQDVLSFVMTPQTLISEPLTRSLLPALFLQGRGVCPTGPSHLPALFISLHISISTPPPQRKKKTAWVDEEEDESLSFVSAPLYKCPCFLFCILWGDWSSLEGPFFSPWHNLSALVIKGFQRALSELFTQWLPKWLGVIRMLDIYHLAEATPRLELSEAKSNLSSS